MAPKQRTFFTRHGNVWVYIPNLIGALLCDFAFWHSHMRQPWLDTVMLLIERAYPYILQAMPECLAPSLLSY